MASYQAPLADQQSGGNAYHELTAHPSAAPTRSRSHRFSTSYLHITSPSAQQQQQQQQQASPQNSGDPAPFASPSDGAANAKLPAPGELKKSSTAGPGAPVLSPEPHKKSKSRNFFGQFSSKSHRESSSSRQQQQQQQQQQQGPPAASLKSSAVSRKISKKNNDSLPEPPQQQQNNSVERLQQTGWQSNQSSNNLPSPQEQQEDDGLDPYLIREKETDRQPSAYDPRLGLTVRVVAEGQVAPQQYHQFQDQQVNSPAQYSPQQYQLASQQHNAPVAEDPQLEYTNQAQQQPGPYQHQHAHQQSLGSFVSPQQYRNPEVISQLSHDSPLDPVDDSQRPPSVQSSQGYTAQQQYPSRTASATQDPPRLTHQSSSTMAPPGQGSQSRKSTDKSLQQQGDNRAAPPGYTQGQFPPPNQSSATTAQSPLPPIPTSQQQQQQQQQPPTNYRNSQLRGEYGPDGRSTPPLQETRELTEMDKLRKSSPSVITPPG